MEPEYRGGMASFFDVLLRGLALSGQAIAIGGVVFAFLVLRAPRASVERAALEPRLSRVWSLVALGAAGVGIAQCLSLGVLVTALGPSSPLRDLLSTLFVRASLVRILASVALVVGALADRRRPARWATGLAVAGVITL